MQIQTDQVISKPNAINVSMSLPDDKPTSPISVARTDMQFQPRKTRNDLQPLIDQLSKLPDYGVIDNKQGQYYGQIVNDKKHGRGILVTDQGICDGNFQNDRKHGLCRETYDIGGVFEGQYQNGKPQGEGIFRKGKEYYRGSWVNGLKHGQGQWENGEDMYQGEWRFGKIDGYGVYLHSGDRYTGTFRNSLKHGHGQELYMNGDMYNGQYCNGKPEGEGTYIWANGTEYRGHFKNGVRHGRGSWMKWDPIKEGHFRYEGQFENDKKHGQGVFTWPNGNHYNGSFINDYRHGYGEMYWKDHYYKGQWERGMQHGEGELCKNGIIKRGTFENNVLLNQRSHSMWEQQQEQFKLCDQSFDKINMKNRIKMMPSLARKPKLILKRQGERSIILENILSPEVPIENDPDFTTKYSTVTSRTHNKKKGFSLILQGLLK